MEPNKGKNNTITTQINFVVESLKSFFTILINAINIGTSNSIIQNANPISGINNSITAN